MALGAPIGARAECRRTDIDFGAGVVDAGIINALVGYADDDRWVDAAQLVQRIYIHISVFPICGRWGRVGVVASDGDRILLRAPQQFTAS
ncbi:hypothetical protein RF55_20849 [Lasius niger]|uniref:Uncharacterized protein n=1 Tax=Lasius niger TaxID=67767 RepID=A0A0J7JYM2_LASNI|nr:hypothetical protein RF55_20849 [Lasius niger]